MLIYALGRGRERGDKPVMNAIATKMPAADFRFVFLVEEIVKSLPFQMRRTGVRS